MVVQLAHGFLKEIDGSNPANMREFQARFASSVKPGDKLVTEVWRTGEFKDGLEEIRFVTSREWEGLSYLREGTFEDAGSDQ